MKKKQRFLFAQLMVIVMMAMSPMRAWAQEADPRMAVFNKLEGVTATFEDEGDYPWGLTRYIGLDALMSTNQGKDETTSKTTIKLACDQAIDLQFSYKTSSEATCDYLIISVDGNEVVNSYDAEPDEDGNTNVYDTYVSPLPANANGHTITMSYIKDNSYSSGNDCGYIYSISAYTHQHYYNATSCDWSEDNTSATLHLECECGETADVEATTITTTEEAPTCEKDGFCTITASAAYNGKTVTYSKTETFAALCHDWQVQSDGTYACQREGCTTQSVIFSIEVIDSSGGFEGEGPEKLFDGDPNTKWCGSDVEIENNSFYVKFKPDKPSVLVSYSLVDAKDTKEYHNRSWYSWEIQGSNDPNLPVWEWELISNEYGGDYQGRTFTTGNTTAYSYYRISFSVDGSEDEYGENYLQQMADMNITWCREHQWGEDGKCTVCGMDECNLSGHDYQVQLDENKKPVFVWSEDYTTATLQLVCSRDAEHTANVDAHMESWVSNPATCTTTGVRTYHATVKYDEKTYADDKNVEIAIDLNAHDIGIQIDLSDVNYEDIITYLDRQDLMPETCLTIICKQCNKEIHLDDTEVISDYFITYGISMNPVCSMNGYYSFNLQINLPSEDGISFSEIGNINALGHSYGEEMSLCSDGYHHYVCTREECGDLSEDKYAKMFGAFREATDDEAPTETIQLTKVGNYYYASLYTDFPYVVGGDDVAYYVTSAENGVVTLGNTAYVRAGSGVIFRSTNSECTIEYDPEGFENTAPEDNLLTGSDEAFVPNANQYAFGLSNEGFLGFWRWPNMTIPAWKAYLELDEETAARGFRIVFDDETNGIQQLPADASAIEGCYDLMGRKVREVKGLGIVNGKKVVVNY